MIWEGEVFVNLRFGPAIQISLKVMLPFALAVWLTVKRKCWMSFLARHNAFIAGAAGSGKSFLIKQISECTTKKIYVTNTTGRAAKVLKNKIKTIHSFAEIGDCHEPKEVCCVFHVLGGCFFAVFLFQKNICLNKLVHAFWLPVSSSHLISVPPNWQRHATKKVRSFIPCHFIIFGERSDPPRNLRVPDFRVISVPDLALKDRAIYRARGLKTHKDRHKTRVIKVIWSFIHILKRMWGLPVMWWRWCGYEFIHAKWLFRVWPHDAVPVKDPHFTLAHHSLQ